MSIYVYRFRIIVFGVSSTIFSIAFCQTSFILVKSLLMALLLMLNERKFSFGNKTEFHNVSKLP